ncbi:MAG: delta-60 repeat domain-containing protein [Nocardioides sp.]
MNVLGRATSVRAGLLLAMMLCVNTLAPGLTAPGGATVATRMDYYAPWGVSGLAVDRLTPNPVYVHDILRIGDRIYVAGAFENVVKRKQRSQPIAQSFLAAFDAANGKFVSDFTPVLDHPAYALKRHPTTGALLVGGEFTQVNGQGRSGIVALDPTTGATDTRFRTDMFFTSTTRAMVKGITVADGRIYLGGSFNGARDGTSAITRRNLVRVALDGTVDPGFSVDVTGGGIWDLETSTDGQRIFAGGRFNAVNGSYRAGLAMIGVDGAVSSAYSQWQEVGPYCYPGYPGCFLIYDLDVDNGQLAVAGAEHFVAVMDDTTGARQWLVDEGHDGQAAMFDGDDVWLARHGSANSTGLWYARNRDSGSLTLSTATIGPAKGEGGFAFERGVDGCTWMGGRLGRWDLTDVAGASKVQANHLLLACPAGTAIP